MNKPQASSHPCSPAQLLLTVVLLWLSRKVGLICSFLNYQPLKSRGGYVYPDWSYHLGLVMALSSMVVVPIYAVAKLCFTKGTLKQVRVNLWNTLQFLSPPLIIYQTNQYSAWLAVVFCPLCCSQRLLVLWYPDRGAAHLKRNVHESETITIHSSDRWAAIKCLREHNKD